MCQALFVWTARADAGHCSDSPRVSVSLSVPRQPGEPVEPAVSPVLAAQRRTPPQFYLSHQQLQLMQYLQSQSQLSPQQQSQLSQLQHQYR